jgi:hypothetical protein
VAAHASHVVAFQPADRAASALIALHTALCAAQWPRWQPASQYETCRQPPQSAPALSRAHAAQGGMFVIAGVARARVRCA